MTLHVPFSDSPSMHNSSKLIVLLATLAVSACSSGPSASAGAAGGGLAGPAVAAAPALDRVPADQALRGQNAFLSSCSVCHGSSEFSDAAFRNRWRNRTAADLFDLTAATMPEDAPNSLPAERYLEIVAYFLTLNGFETADGVPAWEVRSLSEVSLAELSGS